MAIWLIIILFFMYLILSFCSGLLFNYKVFLYTHNQFWPAAFYGVTGAVINFLLLSYGVYLFVILNQISIYLTISLYAMLGIGTYLSTIFTKQFDQLIIQYKLKRQFKKPLPEGVTNDEEDKNFSNKR